MISNYFIKISGPLFVLTGAFLISFSSVFVATVDLEPTVSAFYRVFIGFLALYLFYCIKEKEPNEELFDFITDWYKYLDICDHQLSCFHLMYLLELSRFLGFEPMNDFDEELRTQFDLLDGNFVNVSNTSKYLLPVERSIFVRQLLSADMKQLEHIRIPKDIRNEILKDIIKFYRLHVDNFREPKSLAVIQAILR